MAYLTYRYTVLLAYALLFPSSPSARHPWGVMSEA